MTEPETGIGRVGLRVADIERAVAFYGRVLGLDTLDRTDDCATLGVDDPCLVLLSAPDVPAPDRVAAGLFHTAIRVPSRAALGGVLDRIEARWRLDGASDHRVSEALYLTDPEGNGVEVYRDRPRDAWPENADGDVEMDTLPLALDEVRELGTGDDRPPSGTTVGHVHLEVPSLSAARSFYVDRLGLRLRQSMAGADFFATDDYHHHVGCNTWYGRDRPPAEGTRGLAWFELRLDAPLNRVRSRLGSAASERFDRGDGYLPITDPAGQTVRLRGTDTR
ncbi:VOC family protein [Haloplanus salilacus]|uniref:VOC family protein n=1 Tax=Haloplanus salilacus TaxID=2949994 RepID=UPI0030D2AB25